MITVAFATTFNHTYDTATPVGTDAPSILDNSDRNIQDAIQERLNVEHVFDKTGTEVSHADTGKHTDITCYSVTSTGAISGTTITGSGNLTINTDKFTVTAASGNTLVAGTLDVTGAAEITGVATLGDASLLKTSAAPTTDAMIVNMKYVDDQIAAIQDPTYAGGESHTFDGGLIIKQGYINPISANEDKTVTFAVPFPTDCINGFACNASDVAGSSRGQVMNVFTLTAASMHVFSYGGVASKARWFAIGY